MEARLVLNYCISTILLKDEIAIQRATQKRREYRYLWNMKFSSKLYIHQVSGLGSPETVEDHHQRIFCGEMAKNAHIVLQLLQHGFINGTLAIVC